MKNKKDCFNNIPSLIVHKVTHLVSKSSMINIWNVEFLAKGSSNQSSSHKLVLSLM